MVAVFDFIILFGFSIFLIWFFVKFLLKLFIWSFKKTFNLFIWILNKTKYLLLLIVVGYFAFYFTVYFLWTIGIIFLVFLILAFLSMLSDKKEKDELNKNIEGYLTENNITGLSDYFESLDGEKKKHFINTYKENNNRDNIVLDYLCAMDFCAFMSRHGSGGCSLVEEKYCKEYLSTIWEYKYWDKFYSDIKSQINSASPYWILSEENPKDQNTGKKINFIKLTRKDYDIFDGAISLDD